MKYATARGVTVVTRERIADIHVCGGAEFVKLESGLEVRLDRILELDGAPFRRSEC